MRVSLIKDLGITFDAQLMFDQHIDNIVKRASRALGFIVRLSADFKNIKTMKILYCAFVRNHLEFSSQVWNPHYNVYIEQLEGIQRKFVRYIQYRSKLYLKNYTARCRKFHLVPLHLRRRVADQALLFGIANGSVDCPELLGKIGLCVNHSFLRRPRLLHVPKLERQISNQESVVSSEETYSPAPQFDRLPKSDALVKRAESMSVATKTPKRTPSFTTRRRTQSFRRHRQPDELPPVEIEGYLERKQEAGVGGKRATVRSWRSYYGVLCGQLLCFFRDQSDFASSKAAAPPVAILNARCEPANDYTKRAHVFRLSCTDGAEYLFACAKHELMLEWVAKISFHAALPPQLQLTPYDSSTSPADDVRKRLRNASSSSSATSSPEAQRKVRTQSEILKEHRAATTPERNIESSVLPSLPPRQPPNQEDNADVILRNSEHASGSWGRSRFSNGRDINAEFLRTQREASARGPHTTVTERPPAIPERAPMIPERGPAVPERGPNIPDRLTTKTRPSAERNSGRGSVMSDRGSVMSDRASVMSDRASVMSDRASVMSDRASSDREFDKNSNNSGRNSVSERSPIERDRNSNERYEQTYRYTERTEKSGGPNVPQGEKSVTAMVNSYQQKVNNKNAGWNNNWQGVETTSHFYSASELAYGGNSAGNTRPASVAGSGGSPALDQRPASRSSGESELSVGGTKEKKDKKGVFGGLFSRKKRPQSHM
ncbi:unnamed protein product [Leptosia nina]|uniref:PH domain-containing protein n=1 Tax=Leptosia nina TaxID=320188 RepID=A0AAV1K699_9NEOP